MSESPSRRTHAMKLSKLQPSNKMLTKKLAPLEDVPMSNAQLGAAGTIATSKSIAHKKDLMKEVRRLNPAGVNSAPSIFWDVEGALKTTNIDDDDVKQQMVIVENGVNYNVKRFNDLKVSNERLTRTLKAKLDELDNQKKQFERLDAMKKAETEEGIRIEALQSEVDITEKQIAEKTHYARKLDYMLQRLKSNKLKFDAHMTGMEETMRNISKDAAEVRLMRRGLDAGCAKAQLVLDETKIKLQEARKFREVLQSERLAEYKNAKILNAWLKQREKMKRELGIELRGDLSAEEEKFLRSQIDDRMEKTRVLQKASEEGLKKLQSMEEAFTKLKQVTGVSHLEEMHEKFSNQKGAKLQLEFEVKEAETRLAGAKRANSRQQAIFQELKSSGGGVAELNRENINKLEEAYIDAKTEQKFIKAESERISTVLLGLHQGAQGLLQRVQPYLSLAEGGVFELTQLGEEHSPWTETVEALTTAEHVLTKMMEAISGDGQSTNTNNFDEDENAAPDDVSEIMSVDTAQEVPSNANNIRIRSKKYLQHMESNNAVVERDRGKHDNDEEGGKFSSVLNDKEGAGGMSGAGGEDGGLAASAVERSAVGGVSGVGAGVGMNISGVGGVGGASQAIGGGSNVGGPSGVGGDLSGMVPSGEDLVVPSRVAVKQFSARRSQDAKKKEEMEIRRKRLMDRMENKAAASAALGAEDAGIGLTAALKAQRASADRLSVGHTVPTLPEGVTLRDDPMTKTNAFLSKMPKLN